MFHFSLTMTHLSPTLEGEAGEHYTSSETQSSHSMLLVNADAIMRNRKAVQLRTLTGKPIAICELPGCLRLLQQQLTL